LSEDCLGGPLGSTTKVHTNVAVFNIGLAISSALEFAAAWHKVEISKLDWPENFAKIFMITLKKNYCDAGRPEDAQVFGGEDKDNLIFYLNPAASAVAPKDLRHHHSLACPEPPDLSALRRVPL
jgi:hypothetical protein